MLKASSLVVLLLPALVLAADPAPAIHRPVTDTVGVLSEAEVDTLASELLRLREETGVQLAVLLVGTTHGEPLEDYTLRVAEAWRGGAAGRGDGLLFTLALNDRRMRLEVGYGLEEFLPDDAVRRLLDAQRPLVREQRYQDAIQAVIGGVRERVRDRVVDGVPRRAPAPRLFVGLSGFLWLCGIGGVLGAALAALWWRWAKGAPTGLRVLLFGAPLFGVPFLIARVAQGGPYPPSHLVWVVVLLCGVAFLAAFFFLEVSRTAGLLIAGELLAGILFAAVFSDATRPLALLNDAFVPTAVLGVLTMIVWNMRNGGGEGSGSYSSSEGSGSSSSSSWSSSSSDSSWSSSSSSSDSSWSSSSSDSSSSSSSSSSDYSGGGGDFGGGGASSSW